MPISFYGIRIDPLNVLRTIHFNQTKEKKKQARFQLFSKSTVIIFNILTFFYVQLYRLYLCFTSCEKRNNFHSLHFIQNDKRSRSLFNHFILHCVRRCALHFFFLHNQYGSLWFTVYDSAKDNSSVQLHSLRNSYHFQFTIRNGYLCSRI